MEWQPERARALNQISLSKGPVIYWMSRDQRVEDNWALLYAQKLALETNSELIVFFGLAPIFLGATARQYDFMLKGLSEVSSILAELGVKFVMRKGSPPDEVLKYCTEVNAGAIVADFSPLRIGREWRTQVASKASCAVIEVDAHNIVPCWLASPKQEFAAYTFRPKINKLLEKFLVPFPLLKGLKPKSSAAMDVFKAFLKDVLPRYDAERNDPNANAQSNLSPYLHFGHISAQRIAWEVKTKQRPEIATSFLEELIVRRELSDNYCFYNPHYDNPEGFPDWAKKTLAEHANDKREYIYSDKQFENASTHDELWNAAQREMVTTGKMHGYIRMYWAKKILEWTPNVREAQRIAIWLNDKYELDGRDPNGYCGIAWSIGGVHDRAWFDRPIFGKIRYMSYNGCKSKFAVDQYIAKRL